EKHIENIFSELQIEESFEVHNCIADTLPEWTKQIQLTHEFLIFCKVFNEWQKLQSFIGKDISVFEDYIYWFDGDKIIEQEEKADDETEQGIDFLKKETRLPTYLDDFIFNQLNAEYAPDFQKFDYNLDLTKDENLRYLGTYFPRSYAESFCIFDNIFHNASYQNILSKKKSLNILSIGCGTGGDLIGLLTIIEKHCPQISDVNIWALDGNSDALSILERIVDKFKTQSVKRINIVTLHSVFNSIQNIDVLQINGLKFDFILSFKFVCEIIAMGKGRFDNSYYDFVVKFAPMLSDKGLCLLLDVTTKVEHATYNPILMNLQVNQALRDLENYSTLLPLSCGLYGRECFAECFCQQTFKVTHSKHTKDKSKVAYRIIAHNKFINQIEKFEINSKLLIHDDKHCHFTGNNLTLEDAYHWKNK
ncbi:class I SAM-dependent methyltransferase, partial [Bacteroidales bacterium OttesenSCG-928-C19]|nr:class I SAM-dependent methyltransferase [Bacteroidales bacterium OttesenSCG-928-C19]